MPCFANRRFANLRRKLTIWRCTLLKISPGCWIFAAVQCGDHAAGSQTYGHSLIVDPWGEIVAEAGEEPGIVIADIDPARVAEARRAVPSLTNGRPYRPAGDVKRAAE